MKKYIEFIVFVYIVPIVICSVMGEIPSLYKFNINVVFACTSLIGGFFAIKAENNK